MAASIKADVTPAVLRWARASARLTVEQAAKKAGVKPENLTVWEAGDEAPTLSQARELARVYRRPLSLFFLPEAPRGFAPMVQDYRRLPGEVAGTMTPELAYEIRRAQERREIALELLGSIDEEAVPFRLVAERTESPDAVARRLRDALKVDEVRQSLWRHPYDALNGWRSAFEVLGVLVFQASRIPMAEMRGFSLAEDVLPVVVVNTKDSPTGRVFTMLHELCHVALRKSGVCDVDEDAHRPSEEQAVEVFCNKVAGLALVPTESLRQHGTVHAHGASPEWSDAELQEVARSFGASREAVLRRLLSEGLTTQGFYRLKREQFRAEYAARAEEDASGFATPDRKAVSAAGPAFVRLVLGSYHQERITSSDVADYLGVKVKHLPKIERAVGVG